MHIPTLAALALTGVAVQASTLNRRADAEDLIAKATEFLQMRLNGYEDYYVKNQPKGEFPECMGNSSLASTEANLKKCASVTDEWMKDNERIIEELKAEEKKGTLGRTHALVKHVCMTNTHEGYLEMQEDYLKCLCEDKDDQEYFLPMWKHTNAYYVKECPGLLKELEELETKTYTETYVSYLYATTDSTALFNTPTATVDVILTVTPAAAQATDDAKDGEEEEDKKDDEKKDDEKKDDDKDSAAGVKTWSALAAALSILGAAFSSL